jgi:tRNA(Ile2)-agmatinylcytidine synthase
MDSKDVDEILPIVSEMVQGYAELSYPNTNPGLVVVTGDAPTSLEMFAKKAVWRTVPKTLALRLIDTHNIPHLYHGNGRGIVGALAAVGYHLDDDHTFEYLAYRTMSKAQQERGVDRSSVVTMDTEMSSCTFSNIDPSSDTPLIEPQGPDPVLYGIRGETPQCVIQAASYIESSQDVERWMVFRTNQGTGEHLTHNVLIGNLRPYMSANLDVVVENEPEIKSGGHVYFRVADTTGSIQCAAYEPTGDFRWEVMKLGLGDRITVHAGVRPASSTHEMILNMEGMVICQLADKIEYSNPLCEKCGKRMKSAGKGQGYKCSKCGHKDRHAKKLSQKLPRDLNEGYYLPRPSAQRHLTRPICRVDKYNHFSTEMIEKWHNP